MSIINELIENVLETPYDQFDETVIEEAKDRVIDVIGCITGGFNGLGCKPLVECLWHCNKSNGWDIPEYL